MRVVKSFEEYLNEGIVKKISPDKQRAEDLKIEAKRKYELLKRMIDSLGIDDDTANDYVEFCYDIIMFLIRSHMLNQGFASSGKGAHEAEVAFARKLGFDESEIIILDQLRYFRNGIEYYGKSFGKEYAKKVLDFLEKIRGFE